jgi:hypothetical protein
MKIHYRYSLAGTVGSLTALLAMGVSGWRLVIEPLVVGALIGTIVETVRARRSAAERSEAQ